MVIPEETIIASIAAVGVVLAALIAGVFSLISRKIQNIHIEINSRMTQMLEITRLAAEAAGVKREHDRAAAAAAAEESQQ
jgi:uncharacterized membrane protein YciS (DUF1049 family)